MLNEFVVTWINRQDEKGNVDLHCIIVHTQGVIEANRILRSWRVASDFVSEEFLADDAIVLVEQIIDEWNAAQGGVVE